MATTTIVKNMFSALEDATQVIENEVQDNTTQVIEEDDVQKTETRKLDYNEFPILGVIPKETRKEKKARDAVNVNPTKYIVASSYVDTKRGRNSYENHERGKAFTQMKNKSELAKTLTCTKACQYVLKKVDEETGVEADDHGVCYRETCTFAHSIAELQLPPCAFGDKCIRRNGFKDFNTGNVDKTRKCQFCHPGETADQFYTRTGRDKPDLPATSDKSRQPKPKAVLKKDEVKVAEDPKPVLKRANAVGSVQMSAWLEAATKSVESVKTETTVIRVPKELAQQAMEIAISRGLTDFCVELI
jgi:hypothetical protein